MMQDKANYYMVIPAKVWNSKINPQAILLYGHISTLSTKEGYCWASNDYFEKALGVSEATITRCLNILENDLGVIRRQLVYKAGSKQIESRKIYMVDDYTPIITDEHSPIIIGEHSPIITGDQDTTTSLNTLKPNNIKRNNQSQQGSLDARAAQAGAEHNFKILKEIWTNDLGSEFIAFNLFKSLGSKDQTEFISKCSMALNHGIIPKATSLSNYLQDEI